MKIKAKKPELANNSNSIYFAKKDEENIDFKLNWLYLTVTFWPKTDDNDRDCGKKYKYFSSTAHFCLSTINTCCLFPNVGLLSFLFTDLIWDAAQTNGDSLSCSEVPDQPFKTSLVVHSPQKVPRLHSNTNLSFTEPEGPSSTREERKNKHRFKKTLFMNSPKPWKLNIVHVADPGSEHRHGDDDKVLDLSPSLRRPVLWMFTHSSDRKWCDSTTHLLLQ